MIYGTSESHPRGLLHFGDSRLTQGLLALLLRGATAAEPKVVAASHETSFGWGVLQSMHGGDSCGRPQDSEGTLGVCTAGRD